VLVRPRRIEAQASGAFPIDPPYVGRVAGPMTRTVDDARG